MALWLKRTIGARRRKFHFQLSQIGVWSMGKFLNGSIFHLPPGHNKKGNTTALSGVLQAKSMNIHKAL